MTKQMIGEFLAKHGSVIGVMPDIEDGAEREKYILDTARKLFNEHGELLRTVILRTGIKPQKLMLFTLDIPYEEAEVAPHIIRAAAQSVRAQQLYLAMEAWYSVASKEEYERIAGGEAPRVQPRNNPDRREALVVTSEDAFRVPPSRSWKAEITRDAKGKPTVGPWEDFPMSSGRMTSLLPPEAFVPVGQKMPQS